MAAAEATAWACEPLGVVLEDGPGGVTLVAGFASVAAARRCAARLGPGATVAPSPTVDWTRVHDGPVGVDVGGVHLTLDVGPTFGWGGHPSTRLLLDWMATNPPAGMHVLDVGTGSGVLAVAAARLGAASVSAIDVDAEAVGVAAANAARNGVGTVVRTSPVAAVEIDGSFDLVLANLTAGTLRELGRDLVRLSAGGTAAVSGMLTGQETSVAAALGPAEVVERLVLDGWVALVLA